MGLRLPLKSKSTKLSQQSQKLKSKVQISKVINIIETTNLKRKSKHNHTAHTQYYTHIDYEYLSRSLANF